MRQTDVGGGDVRRKVLLTLERPDYDKLEESARLDEREIYQQAAHLLKRILQEQAARGAAGEPCRAASAWTMPDERRRARNGAGAYKPGLLCHSCSVQVEGAYTRRLAEVAPDRRRPARAFQRLTLESWRPDGLAVGGHCRRRPRRRR